MATYSKKQLTDAIRAQCCECNDLKTGWDFPGNDCTGKSCPLYPFRPGHGPGHAERAVIGRKTAGSYGTVPSAVGRKSTIRA